MDNLDSIEKIIATVYVVVQAIKSLPYLEKIPTKILAVIVGAGLTAFAFYTHAITGDLLTLVATVVISILGAPSLHELFEWLAKFFKKG